MLQATQVVLMSFGRVGTLKNHRKVSGNMGKCVAFTVYFQYRETQDTRDK